MSLLTLEANIKSHLVSLVVVAVLIAGSVWGINSLMASHDAKSDAKWAALIASNDAKNKTDEAALQATLTAVLAENANLAAQVSQRNVVLQQVVKTIQAAPPSQIAKDLGGTSPDPTTVLLPMATARDIDTKLATLSVAEANLVSETQIAANDQTIIDGDKKVITDLNTSLANYEPVDKPCAAQISTIKANNRKHALYWFGAGFIAGRISKAFF